MESRTPGRLAEDAQDGTDNAIGRTHPEGAEPSARRADGSRVGGLPSSSTRPGEANTTARPAMIPSSEAVSGRMSRLGQRDTAPELALRRALHGRGLRYRVHQAPLAGVRSRADIVFGPARVAVYVDGCFWHSCPIHGTAPRANADFWSKKLARNRQRDRETDVTLRREGWISIRVWEHEDMSTAAERIAGIVQERRSKGGTA
jgi:DNA mismatch endonuclease (patch repair protein)